MIVASRRGKLEPSSESTHQKNTTTNTTVNKDTSFSDLFPSEEEEQKTLEMDENLFDQDNTTTSKQSNEDEMPKEDIKRGQEGRGSSRTEDPDATQAWGIADDQTDEPIPSKPSLEGNEIDPEATQPWGLGDTETNMETTGREQTKKTNNRNSRDSNEEKTLNEEDSVPQLADLFSGLECYIVPGSLDAEEGKNLKKFFLAFDGEVNSRCQLSNTHILRGPNPTKVTLKSLRSAASQATVVTAKWAIDCMQQRKLLDETPYIIEGE